MARYKAPGIAVYQTIQQNALTFIPDQDIAVVGGSATLRLYDAPPAERARAYVGEYLTGTRPVFDWERGIGDANVDLDFTKVFFRNALLRYEDNVPVTIIPNSLNQITVDVTDIAEVIVESTGAVRGVRIGDVVGMVIEGEQFFSAIHAIEPVLDGHVTTNEPVAGASGNRATIATTTATVSRNSSAENSGVNITPAVSGSDYVVPTNRFDKQYVVNVVQGGERADAIFFLTGDGGEAVEFTLDATGKAVTSGGNDPVLGLELTFTGLGSAVFTQAQVWTISMLFPYTRPTIVANGQFRGLEDVTYIVDVQRTGRLDGTGVRPVVRVRTASGLDTAAEFEVVQGATYALGTQGLTFSVTGGAGMIQGESFFYTTTAVAVSTVRKITLQQNIPAFTAAPTSATLQVLRNLSVGAAFWGQNQNNVTLEAFISSLDFEFGIKSLPIVKADVYIESRIWNTAVGVSAGAGTIENGLDLESVFPGQTHPANPLKYAIFKALQNSAGRPVIYGVVHNPADVDSWTAAFNRVSKNRDAYAIVPLTTDPIIQRLTVNFVLGESSDEINRRKQAWLYQPLDVQVPVVVWDPARPTWGTVIDNPDTQVVDFNTVLSEHSDFVAAGVRPGDEFRIEFYTDANGDLRYSSRTVARVVNGNMLVLDRPFNNSIDVPQRYEIWRPITTQNFNENVTALNTWDNRRVIAVHPFTVAADGYRALPGYIGAVMIAARTMGLPPNQASTLFSLRGVADVSGMEELSEQNLNALAQAGITMLTKDHDENIFIRHTITTGTFDILHEREEMTTRNFDSVSNYYTAALMQLRGRLTATVEGLTAVFDTIQKTSDALMLRFREGGRSGQVVGYNIRSVSIDPVFRDVINVDVLLELPLMANRIELHLQVISDNSAIGVNLGSA